MTSAQISSALAAAAVTARGVARDVLQLLTNHQLIQTLRHQ